MEQIRTELGDLEKEFQEMAQRATELRQRAEQDQCDPLATDFAKIAVRVAEISASNFSGELLLKGFALATAIADLGTTFERLVKESQ